MWRNTDNILRLRWRFIALISLSPLLAFAQTAPPPQPFQRLDGCAYKPQRWDDEHVKILSLSDELLLDKRQEDRGLAVRVVEHLESDLQIL
jgi:hypothetical protein